MFLATTEGRDTPRQGAELRRMPLPRTPMNKRLLACLLALPACIRAQPKRDVGRLHSFPYYTHQLVIEGFQVRLVLQLGGECFQSGRERAVDEGTVDDDVDVVEAVAKDSYPHRDRNARKTSQNKGTSDPSQPR